jgi:hypothetical protein
MPAVTARRAHLGLPRLGGWVAVTYLGFAMFGDIHLQMVGPTTLFRPSDIAADAVLVGFLFGGVSGALIASLQWIVLRSWAPRARGWIPCTAIGFGLAHALNDAVPYRPLDLLVILLIGGVLIGAMQAVALRRVIARPWVWVPVVALAWSLGWTVAAAVIVHIDHNPLAELFLANGAAGLVIGAVTGGTLPSQLCSSEAAEGNPPAGEFASPTQPQ